jgi:hypothetical protein
LKNSWLFNSEHTTPFQFAGHCLASEMLQKAKRRDQLSILPKQEDSSIKAKKGSLNKSFWPWFSSGRTAVKNTTIDFSIDRLPQTTNRHASGSTATS